MSYFGLGLMVALGLFGVRLMWRDEPGYVAAGILIVTVTVAAFLGGLSIR